MTKPNHSHIKIILDSSGSMEDLWDETIGSVNAYLDDQRLVPGTADVTVTLFDERIDTIARGNLATLAPIDKDKHRPRGMTRLLDALGFGIKELGEELAALPEHERPSTVIMLIQTDGKENNSQVYKDPAVVKKMVEHQREKYGWQFIFGAADLESIELANSIGISTTKDDHYETTGKGTRALYTSMSVRTRTARGA